MATLKTWFRCGKCGDKIRLQLSGPLAVIEDKHAAIKKIWTAGHKKCGDRK